MGMDAKKDLDGAPLPALVDLAPPGLDRVLQHCQGYPAPGLPTAGR
ncbi:MAG TPA: hypothetical protein VG294_01030 [Solirubrobacteraceae bacterium]|nr:hypothetical protein [Solirubrobacteraceae bacterium]